MGETEEEEEGGRKKRILNHMRSVDTVQVFQVIVSQRGTVVLTCCEVEM